MKTIQSGKVDKNEDQTIQDSCQPVRMRKQVANGQISNEQRKQLIDLISETNSIRYAAKKLRINESTAKSIYYKFRSTGETDKTDLKKQHRWAPRRKQISQGCKSNYVEIVPQLIQEQSSEHVGEEKSGLEEIKDENLLNLNSAGNNQILIRLNKTYNSGAAIQAMTNKPE